MFNTTDIILKNMTGMDATKVCELNQYAMLEATNKLPIVCLYLSLAIFIILGFNWLIVPFLYKWKYYEDLKEGLPGMAFAVSIWLPLILMYFTLNLTEKGFKYIEDGLIFFVLIVIATQIYYHRRRIQTWIRLLQK